MNLIKTRLRCNLIAFWRSVIGTKYKNEFYLILFFWSQYHLTDRRTDGLTDGQTDGRMDWMTSFSIFHSLPNPIKNVENRERNSTSSFLHRYYPKTDKRKNPVLLLSLNGIHTTTVSVCVCVCLSVCLSICLSVSLSVKLFEYRQEFWMLLFLLFEVILVWTDGRTDGRMDGLNEFSMLHKLVDPSKNGRSRYNDGPSNVLKRKLISNSSCFW